MTLTTLYLVCVLVADDEASVELVRRIEHTKTDKISELARTIELTHRGNREGVIARAHEQR